MTLTCATAHATVCELIASFEQGEATFMSPNYQEAQVRADYLDKFFTALGWDVAHHIQTNPYEQEVKIERPVNTGGAKRRADYAFALAPRFNRPLFFVEAKRPQANIATADNYFQAIRYSWNTQLPLVLLTDFASFHLIDARHRPQPCHRAQSSTQNF
jgi:adenine-specific DNA-methyltransferase